MKHLFLEGPIQTGKSTLIRKALKHCMDSGLRDSEQSGDFSESFLGGFASQRLVLPTGETAAFRIGSAHAPLTAPLEDYVDYDSSGRIIIPGNSAIFKFIGDRKGLVSLADPGTRTDTEVFEGDILHYLNNCDGCRLILLDEIGGHELLNPKFMAALHRVLAGKIPCIGVIKQLEDSRRMDPALADFNIKLREKITGEYDGDILYYERGDEAVARAVDYFLSVTVNSTCG